MKVINDGFEAEVPLSSLAPHPRNVNQGDLGAIHQSIGELGFYGAVIVQRSTGFILAGNHRYQAAVQNHEPSIPVIWVSCDDLTGVKILLADNRITRMGIDDAQALAELLQEIRSETGELTGTGYDDDALVQIMEDLTREFVPEPAAARNPREVTCPRCSHRFTQ